MNRIHHSHHFRRIAAILGGFVASALAVTFDRVHIAHRRLTAPGA